MSSSSPFTTASRNLATILHSLPLLFVVIFCSCRCRPALLTHDSRAHIHTLGAAGRWLCTYVQICISMQNWTRLPPLLTCMQSLRRGPSKMEFHYVTWSKPKIRTRHACSNSFWEKSVLILQRRILSVGFLISLISLPTSSLYQLMTHWGVKDQLCSRIWKCKVPLKVRVFMWQLFHDKSQNATALKRRRWKGSPLCCVCGKPETCDHIFFECIFAQYIWCCIRDAFDLGEFPISRQEFVTEWLPRRLKVPQKLALIFFAGLTWASWKNRNKMAIEKVFPSNPDSIIYAAVNCVQMWGDLLKEADKTKLTKWRFS